MDIYFDCEFSGLHKKTTLISIGFITEDGDTFYAEFDDYDRDQCDDWIKENVIKKLNVRQYDKDKKYIKNYHYGNKYQIKEMLLVWLKQFEDTGIQFISDVCHYDFVLLIDLIADSALSMPKNISPVCLDINVDIAKYFKISEKNAFNKNREEILKEFKIELLENKHNALYDAIVIKEIYENILMRTIDEYTNKEI